MSARKPYARDISDDNGALIASRLLLMPEHAEQREHAPREVFHGFVLGRQDWHTLALDVQ